MGLFDKLFTPKQKSKGEIREFFKTLNAYTPVFTSYDGGLYEMELVRAAIHANANHSAKLQFHIEGSAMARLERQLQYRANDYHDMFKFLYRVRTILEVENNAFIIPVYDDNDKIRGYYPVLPSRCELMEYQNTLYLRYTFANGKKAAIEYDRVGIVNKFQYKSDFFGETNSALNNTTQLIHTQNQGIIEGIKASATVRFMGRLANVYKSDTIDEERQRFRSSNLSQDNNNGLILVDNKYADLQQIESKPYTIDAEQRRMIEDNVYKYFGVNEKIIKNEFDEEEWTAYYEGNIEPFAIQLSLVLTNMTFTKKEISTGNYIQLLANRLQYASNKTKIEITTQLFDRGLITRNEGRDIFNMAHVGDADGDKYFIRKEYAAVDDLGKEELNNDNEG